MPSFIKAAALLVAANIAHVHSSPYNNPYNYDAPSSSSTNSNSSSSSTSDPVPVTTVLSSSSTVPVTVTTVSSASTSSSSVPIPDQCLEDWCFNAVSAFVLVVEESFCKDFSTTSGSVVPADLQGYCYPDDISSACGCIPSSGPTTTSSAASTSTTSTESASITSTSVSITSSSSSSSSSSATSSSSSVIPIPTGSSVVYKGADISSLLMLEEGLEAQFQPYQWEWKVDNNPPKLENLLKAGGVNIIRLRLWHTDDADAPDAYGLQYNLKLAKRVIEAGMMVYLDIMYSDTWADPSHNHAPVSWQGYNQAEMETAVVDYTSMVMEAFSAAQIPLEIVSIGNEITRGMLWPLGGDSTKGANYAAVAPLIHKASVAIRSSSQSPSPKIMTHCDQGANLEVQLKWYKNMFLNGLDVSDIDIIGGTFYPFYSSWDTQGALTNTFTQLSQLYNKPCMVVETNWPIACPDPGWLSFATDLWGVVNTTSTGRFPFSGEGQRGWMSLLSESLNQVPNRMGAGIFYWEPAFANNTGLGTPCDDNSMMTWMWGANADAEGGYAPIGVESSAISVFADL